MSLLHDESCATSAGYFTTMEYGISRMMPPCRSDFTGSFDEVSLVPSLGADEPAVANHSLRTSINGNHDFNARRVEAPTESPIFKRHEARTIQNPQEVDDLFPINGAYFLALNL